MKNQTKKIQAIIIINLFWFFLFEAYEDTDIKLASFNYLQSSFWANGSNTLKFSFDYKKKK